MEKINGKGSFFWIEESNEQTPIPIKHKRKVKSKKVEFIGWGSKPLIEFLQSVGKDTGEERSQYEVVAIINDYVHKLNLADPSKKKKVVCDERLLSIFGKKTVHRNKIHDLLKSHFAKSRDSSEDEELYTSEEYDDDSVVTFKKQKVSSLEKKAPTQKKKAPETLLSCFAAIIPENIKLLYLKRSLVQELVKQPESFERKVLGSYIRIKSDPNDYSQKNSHQLLPVTGVKNVGGTGEILLQIPMMTKDFRISMLSDDDFSKEECEELCQRVKDGLLKRPTVVEVEEKAQLLHEDIIKHWLPRELAYLQNLIDRANEKGWRKELFEYLERRKLLQTPAEQSKLLTEVPKVTADVLDPEATPQEDVQELNTSPISNHIDLPNGPDAAQQPVDLESSKEPIENKGSEVIPSVNVNSEEKIINFQWGEAEKISNTNNNALDLNSEANVIELSDDEEKTHEQEDELEMFRSKWFYLDPQGKIQGPVSKNELKTWSDLGYFLPDFKVWKDGQTPDSAILLVHMLSGTF